MATPNWDIIRQYRVSSDAAETGAAPSSADWFSSPWGAPAIQQWGQQYLGRAFSPEELAFHSTDPLVQMHIAKSPEAAAWAARGEAPTSTAGPAGTAPGPGAAPSTYNREALSQALQQIQFSNNPYFNPAEFIAQHQGDFAQGVTMVSPDKIRLPDGELVDIGGDIGAGGTGKAWWGSESDWQKGNLASGGAMARAEAAAAAAAGGGGSVSTGFSGTAGLTPGNRANELYEMLLGRVKQGLDVDRTSPTIRQQVDPYAAQQERAMRDYLAQVAEREGPRGNITSERRMAAERMGQATGLLESQLIGREITARRQEISDALTQMGNLLTEEQRIAMQKELAQLDDAARRYGIDVQAKTAGQQIGLGYSELDWRRDPYNPQNWID